VAPPSSAKTPALKMVAAPVYREQGKLHEIFRKKQKAHADGLQEDKPKESVLCVSDCTTEKLAEVLHDNVRGVLQLRDELTGWVSAMNQYKAGRGADRQFYLSVWAGEPVNVHRKNQERGSVFVAHPFLGVCGGLPPDLLDWLRGERKLCDGFLDRILFTFPTPPRAIAEDWCCLEDQHAEQWEKVLTALRQLEMVDEPEGAQRPLFVAMTSTARRAWEAFTGRLADEMNTTALPDCLRGPWGKMRGYGARLALIVHCLRLASHEIQVNTVDDESIKRADRLVSYFQSHARKVYATLDADPRMADARRVVTWLGERARSVKSVNSVNDPRIDPGHVTKRDIHANVLGSRYSVEDVDAVLSLLMRYGYLRLALVEKKAGPGRKPSPPYEVHPLILSWDGSHNSQNSRNTYSVNSVNSVNGSREPGEEG
jgi:hypothetical protein